MNDEELRGLIRESIARHLSAGERPARVAAPPDPRVLLDPSHGLLPLVSGGDSSGACLIEPSVPCTHCGYCKSFGH
jgi:hypothetical protein